MFASQPAWWGEQLVVKLITGRGGGGGTGIKHWTGLEHQTSMQHHRPSGYNCNDKGSVIPEMLMNHLKFVNKVRAAKGRPDVWVMMLLDGMGTHVTAEMLEFFAINKLIAAAPEHLARGAKRGPRDFLVRCEGRKHVRFLCRFAFEGVVT